MDADFTLDVLSMAETLAVKGCVGVCVGLMSNPYTLNPLL